MKNIETDKEKQRSRIVIQLLKGPIYHESDLWLPLLENLSTLNDYFRCMNLSILLSEADGHALLRPRLSEDKSEGPTLISHRSLSFPVSLLLVLLRKRLLGHDTENHDQIPVISFQELVNQLNSFLPQTSNESKRTKQIRSYVTKVIELGVLRPLKLKEDQFEVRRVIKSVITPEWLEDLDEVIKGYQDYARA